MFNTNSSSKFVSSRIPVSSQFPPIAARTPRQENRAPVGSIRRRAQSVDDRGWRGVVQSAATVVNATDNTTQLSKRINRTNSSLSFRQQQQRPPVRTTSIYQPTSNQHPLFTRPSSHRSSTTTARGSTLPSRSNQINQKQQEEKSRKDAEIEMLRKQLDEANEQLRMESESKKMWMDSAREAQEKVTTAAARIKALEDELRTLKEKRELMQLKLLDSDIEIRQLYETCIDLKGRIRLCVRIRPLIGNECVTFQYIDIVNDNTIQIMHRSKAVQCECEHLWLDDASQSDVFESVSEFIRSALYGSNVAIIAYGQTGSGKTYTMRGGDGDSAGIIPRALAMLFDSSAELQLAGWVVEISLSILEIYVGRCYDLLDEHERRPFTLHFANNNPDFRELTSLAITTVDEALTGIARSDMLRSWARTDTSEYSSRGHTIVRIQISSYLPQQNKCLSSCISLVDLAGSERVKESGVSGERLEETKYINKSLSQLGVVLRAELAQGNHVPYTSDPLTKALSESLGAGSSKTMLIANIRPDSAANYESYRTIEFANQAMLVKTNRSGRHC